MYLSAPDAPSTISRPDVPYCLQGYGWSRKHTCSDWELDSYKSEVEEYIDDLNDYISEANSFAEEAIRFANDASDYARCEADEVLEQHQ